MVLLASFYESNGTGNHICQPLKKNCGKFQKHGKIIMPCVFTAPAEATFNIEG
jgi:hypothetical protein